MAIEAFPVNNVLKTYTKIMRNRSGRESDEPGGSRVKDLVTISHEGKRKQVMEFAAREIIERVKETK